MGKKATLINHVGERFGRLTVLKWAGRNKHNQTTWLCRCDCGNEITVVAGNLRSSNSQSCGCLNHETWKRETLPKLIIAITKHGDATHKAKSRLYRIWCNMKGRCSNRKTSSFSLYGAKGIRVCEAWKTSYQMFKKWALTHGYSDTLTIDRIKPRGDYCPVNCQWIPGTENTQKALKHRWAKQRQLERLSEQLCCTR